ncbi:DUF969 domain-containing protein [Marilutibacter chinensis]|uniref:DUF969 domain-containing protein n=1 Tax=Marilutibacter chinensis TaxID=2912247 RepID=A0ABS9HXB1_9GAMM|nr:DUF969 domain-containing protein [Lysobacter chinensis]MCF7223196.1 DUF969 domain-containing protein [Lysobacter chinensis]
MNYWPLLGVACVVAGFMLRFNPVVVVVTAGLVSGLAAGKSVPELLALLGNSFVSNRALLLFAFTLPTIGLLERAGLREHAIKWIASWTRLTLTKLLVAYLGIRQLLSMLGLIDIAGHAQTVRPLLAPMSTSAAEKVHGPLEDEELQKVHALGAATDNVGRFFGEDVFLAFGAVLLIQGFYAEHGIVLEPLQIALWALPTAVAAFAIHAVRVQMFDRALRRRLQAAPPAMQEARETPRARP